MPFIWIGLALVALWILGFLVFHIVSVLIHLLLIAAVLAIVWHFVVGRRRHR